MTELSTVNYILISLVRNVETFSITHESLIRIIRTDLGIYFIAFHLKNSLNITFVSVEI